MTNSETFPWTYLLVFHTIETRDQPDSTIFGTARVNNRSAEKQTEHGEAFAENLKLPISRQ